MRTAFKFPWLCVPIFRSFRQQVASRALPRDSCVMSSAPRVVSTAFCSPMKNLREPLAAERGARASFKHCKCLDLACYRWCSRSEENTRLVPSMPLLSWSKLDGPSTRVQEVQRRGTYSGLGSSLYLLAVLQNIKPWFV